MSGRRIPAEFWRGGTSKGVFFLESDLPSDTSEREALLLRVVGSPDPYGRQMDGMGGGISSTSKVVIVRPSRRAGCDVEYRFGAVAIDRPVIDWSGNCGNLTTAVGPFAIRHGLVRGPDDGTRVVTLWQDNVGKRIVAHVPMADGEPLESGDFMMDGVAFPGAEILLEFLDPGGGESALLPTGNVTDRLAVPGVGDIDATLVNAGNPTAFVAAGDLGLTGTELPPQVNADASLLERCEAVRAQAAVRMGLAPDAAAATRDRPATPKLSFVAPATAYVASSGRQVRDADIDFVARILSMGALHHAYTGTGAVAIAVAAALPGSVVSAVCRSGPSSRARIGHASGTMTVGAEISRPDGTWQVVRALMSRSARCLMSGSVHLPD
ncbi:MAG: 2-methylaconitate cis-trans isomerase PrpF [Betaproteobacteria bacterium]|nr:2-methylaconitate cis-trans isomerase PrpF [Betaproteobacteria bacterium]